MVQPRIGDGETVGMMVRMSAALRDRIKAAAEKSGRSQNSEILNALEKAFPAPEPGRNLLAAAIDLALPGVRAATSDEEALMAIQAGNEVLAKTNLQWRLILTHAGDKRAIGFVEA